MHLSRLPDCEIYERIGVGGVADVFRGAWRGREAALKVLRDPSRPGLRERFLREGRMLQRLSHPGLVQCFEVLDGEQPVLVMELLRGESIEARLLSDPIPAEEGVGVASSVLRALGYLHENGVTHRDIKAGNVFICDDGRVVVMDLGLAGDRADPLTTTLGDVLGTLAYMAPEQIAGAETDPRCDLYSLGVTLYEALCGERPYLAQGLAAYLYAHRNAGASPLVERVPSIPVRLAVLVDRLMACDPTDRPSSAGVALALLTGGGVIRSQLNPPQFVGRAELEGAVRGVLEAGGVLRLTGELGCGLGAAARVARRIAREGGMEHVAVRCRARAGVGETFAGLARELEALVGMVPPDPAGVRSAIATMCSQDHRFLLVVEELDLAPEGVALALESLTDLAGLTIVVTGRALPSAPAGHTFELRPLTVAEVHVLLGSLFGTPVVPAGLDAGIARASGGLPAVVVALLREQVESGAVWCEDHGDRPRWAWDGTPPLLPGGDTFRWLERGIRSLPEGSLVLVRALAVAGRPVPLDLLLTAAGADPSGIDMGDAVRHGVCALSLHDGEEWVSLRRAVLEPILLRGLPDADRLSVHLALAEAVRRRPAGDWERRFELMHAARGAREPVATHRLVELGDGLIAEDRPVEALIALDAAALLPVEDREVSALLALARAEALLRIGRLPDAQIALDAGRRIAMDAGNTDPMRRAALASAELQLAFGTPLPADLRARVDAAALEGVAQAALVQAEVALRDADLERASGLFEQTLQGEQRVHGDGPSGGVRRVGIAARMGIAAIAALQGDHSHAAQQLRGLSATLRATDRSLPAAEALARLADTQRAQGQLAAAFETLDTAEALVADRSHPWVAGALAVVGARLALACGDVDGAAALLAPYASFAEAYAPWIARRAWLSAAAELREASHDSPAAVAAHLRAAAACAAAGDHAFQAFHEGALAILTADREGVYRAVQALAGIGIPVLQARLLALGGRIGRASDVLRVAEVHARAAGEQMLLLGLLDAGRDPEARPEARAICLSALAGLRPAPRARFLERPVARWALGERGCDRRDTGG